MSVTKRYKDAWEGFWREAPGEPGAVFWDAEPEITAAVHLDLFAPHLTEPRLPFVDLGCGNGTQTAFIAQRFGGPSGGGPTGGGPSGGGPAGRVIGLDVATAAVEHARKQHAHDAVEFLCGDAADADTVAGLRASLGDSNVYLRGVLHQAEPDDRRRIAASIATLVGRRGRAFVVEPSEAAGAALQEMVGGPAGPPPKMLPVFRHGIAPGTLADADVPGLFRTAGLAVLSSGELPLATTEHTPDGTRIELPSTWLVVGRPAATG
ncbi:class I SAM-dependent methyltransferase [Streptomyces sp. NPDC047928]|uniref:class I SAM-dependent methyltransferase n=1 Tax=unclassified Streptomyces TaxID=2593676 RepID=UPI00371EF8B8